MRYDKYENRKYFIYRIKNYILVRLKKMKTKILDGMNNILCTEIWKDVQFGKDLISFICVLEWFWICPLTYGGIVTLVSHIPTGNNNKGDVQRVGI